MKKINYSKIFLIIILISFNAKCYSFNNYISNRVSDFADIVTISGEIKTVGGSAWFWCFGGGVQMGRYAEGYGFRNGYLGHYRAGGNSEFAKMKLGNSFLLMNSQEHIPEANKTARSMNKKYTHANFLLILPANLQGRHRGSITPLPSHYYDLLPSLCRAPANFELSLGLGIGGRIGFNVSELLDFLLGFTTYDLMEDDSKAEIEEINNE